MIAQEGVEIAVTEDFVVARRVEPFSAGQVGVGDAGVDGVEREAQLLLAAHEVGVRLFLRAHGLVGAVPGGDDGRERVSQPASPEGGADQRQRPREQGHFAQRHLAGEQEDQLCEPERHGIGRPGDPDGREREHGAQQHGHGQCQLDHRGRRGGGRHEHQQERPHRPFEGSQRGVGVRRGRQASGRCGQAPAHGVAVPGPRGDDRRQAAPPRGRLRQPVLVPEQQHDDEAECKVGDPGRPAKIDREPEEIGADCVFRQGRRLGPRGLRAPWIIDGTVEALRADLPPDPGAISTEPPGIPN